MMQYILNEDHSTRRATDDAEAAEQWKRFANAGPFLKGHPKVVDRTEVEGKLVSTVFLILDHNFGYDGPDPILFETMVFASERDGSLGPDLYCQRYATWEEAYNGHQKVVARIKAG